MSEEMEKAYDTLLEEARLEEAKNNDPVELRRRIKDQETRIQGLVEALENISEFISMIPLHTEDEHALHFVQMAQNWCDKALTAYKEGE